jgi:DnaJ-class molecular chaperone
MDHYETLGVARTATKDEIQKAYHEMAVKYHPDANPGDAKSASRMAEINTAYQILRNPAKRKEYDLTLGGGGTARPQAPQPGSGPRPGPSPQPGGRRPSAGPMSDLLGGMMGEAFSNSGSGGSSGQTTTAGGVPVVTIELTAAEALRGATKTIYVNKRPLNIQIVIRR